MQVIRLNTSAAHGRDNQHGLPQDDVADLEPRSAVRLYRQIMRRYLPGRKASDVYHYYEWRSRIRWCTLRSRAGT